MNRPDARGAEYRGRHYDPDATMLLPIYSADPDATLLLPVIDERTVLLPVRDRGPIAPPAGPPPVRAPGVPPPPVPPGVPVPPVPEAASVARSSAVMALGSLVSRFTGFLRTAVIGAAIGAAAVNNDYTIANTLPNMVYELLLGGVLASVIVPLLVRARRREADGGDAYAQRLLTLAVLVLGIGTVLAVAMAPLLTALLTRSKHTSAADAHLTTVLGYLLLPEIFFYGIAAMIAAILNTRGHFAAPMWTPILNNVVVITTAGLFMLLPSAPVLTAETIRTEQILVLGIGTTLGIVVQAAGLLPALRRVGFRWRARFDFRQLHLRELRRVGGWMLGYVAVSQFAVLVVLRLAYLAAASGSHHSLAGPAIYNNAFLIFMMANGIVAVSIITALMPRMAAAAADHRYADVADYLSLGARLSAVILVPATAAYVIFGRQLGIVLFSYGKTTIHQGVLTGWVIAAAGLGLVPFAVSQMQIFAFYSLPDTKTPALVNIPVVGVRILLALIFYWALPAGWVAAFLMIGGAISYVIGAALSNRLLRRRLGPLGLTRVFSTLGRLTTAAVLAAVPTVPLVLVLERAFGTSHVGSAVELLVGGTVFLAVYLGTCVGLRVREVSEVWRLLRGRTPR